MSNLGHQKALLKDYAYVRGGVHASKNWIKINEEISRTNLVVKSSPDDSLNRRVILKFDLSDISMDNAQTVELKFPVTGNLIVHFDIYEITNDWNGKTVTWNDVTPQKLVAENVTSIGLTKIILTDYIYSLFEKGVKEFSLMIIRKEIIDNETGVPVSDNLLHMPHLSFAEKSEGSYAKKLCEDSDKNAKIWEVAEEEYKNWIKMEALLSSKKEPNIHTIKTPSEQFGKTTKHKAQSNAPVFFESPTRTYSDIKDINEYADTVGFEYDKFGGMMIESIKQTATGFFYSKKINDRWWLIDPLGYPYFILGLDVLVCTIQNSGRFNA